jgi:hypothetical protein
MIGCLAAVRQALHNVLPAAGGGGDECHRPGFDPHECLGEGRLFHGGMLKVALDTITGYETFSL